ncbi:MAG: glycosyltransferase [Ignavibacteriales bacterium]|nr:glycosyltransferase [Ignavibacteriales bacterium]
MSFPKNIALIHDWLVSMRGGEKVFEVLCELFPSADVFTLVHKKGSLSPSIERMNIKTSFIQHIPNAMNRYQYYLPFYPTAIERFNLDEYDLVISSSHAAAKGVRTRREALHICYCHTPMRYIWDQYEQYFGKGRASWITRSAMSLSLGYLRRWDVESAKRVNYFIANSRNVRERIQRIYHQDSQVIYPPVDVERFSVSTRDEGYYLVVSALVPYKRIDIAVEAFNQLGEKLVVIGTGAEEKRLKSLAKKNIEFLGWVGDAELQKYYASCRAIVFPGEEDFGIVPVEGMSCGKPVIAFSKGGALETVIEGKTGLFFNEQEAESLAKRIKEIVKFEFEPSQIKAHVQQFDKMIFIIDVT